MKRTLAGSKNVERKKHTKKLRRAEKHNKLCQKVKLQLEDRQSVTRGKEQQQVHIFRDFNDFSRRLKWRLIIMTSKDRKVKFKFRIMWYDEGIN